MAGSQMFSVPISRMNAGLCVYVYILLPVHHLHLCVLLYICLLSVFSECKLHEDRDFILFLFVPFGTSRHRASSQFC